MSVKTNTCVKVFCVLNPLVKSDIIWDAGIKKQKSTIVYFVQSTIVFLDDVDFGISIVVSSG